MASKQLNKMTRGELEAELVSYQSRAYLYAATEKVASIGYFEWDFKRNCIVSCSEIYADIFGMSVADVIAAQDSWKNCLQFVHTDDRDRFDRLARKENHAQIREIKFRIVRPDGVVRHIRRMDMVTVDENSNDRRAFGLCQDLTSLVERERELEYRESLLDRAESITEIGHYIYDEQNQRQLYVSPGYTVSTELIKMNICIRATRSKIYYRTYMKMIVPVYSKPTMNTKSWGRKLPSNTEFDETVVKYAGSGK